MQGATAGISRATSVGEALRDVRRDSGGALFRTCSGGAGAKPPKNDKSSAQAATPPVPYSNARRRASAIA